MIFGRSRRSRWDGTKGRPRSANGASSLHLTWAMPEPVAGDPWVGAEAVLEVREAPRVLALYFWALQASFTDRGRHGGAGHLGLQWYPAHPGSTAVNWGGYGADGRELDGTTSALPSATGNPHTRDFRWRASVPYRLRISRTDRVDRSGRRAWRGEVTDLVTGDETVVRELWAPGEGLDHVVVWSEVFATCDDPGTEVGWSRLRLTSRAGRSDDVASVIVNYQSVADGGCSSTDTRLDGDQIVQATGTVRTTPLGVHLPVPPNR